MGEKLTLLPHGPPHRYWPRRTRLPGLCWVGWRCLSLALWPTRAEPASASERLPLGCPSGRVRPDRGRRGRACSAPTVLMPRRTRFAHSPTRARCQDSSRRPGYHQSGLTPPRTGSRWSLRRVARPLVTVRCRARPAAGRSCRGRACSAPTAVVVRRPPGRCRGADSDRLPHVTVR